MRLSTTCAPLAAVCMVAACSFTPGALPGDAAPPEFVTIGFTEASTLADEKSGTVMIEVALSGEPAQPVTFGYRLAMGGTATVDSDFTLSEGTLVLSTSAPQAVPVTILPDGEAEADETIVLELHSIVGATIGQRMHTITISANTLPRVNFMTATSQTAEAGTTVMLDVTLDATPNVPVSATYTVTGSATDGSDYTITQGSVDFAVGQTAAQIAVTILQDTLAELDETVVVDFSGATAALVGTTTPSHVLTIVDDADPDPDVYFTVGSQQQTEGNVAVTLMVTLSGPSGKPITVPFAAGGGSTAADPADYSYMSTASLTFAPETTTPQTITINVAADTIDEDDETALTALGTPTNATLSATMPVQHTLTILDDDQACFGPASGNARICLDRGPTQPVSLPATIDTDASALCEATQPTGWTTGGQPAACFIKGTTIAVGTTTVTGARPLVLVASTSLDISTLLDVSSNRVAGRTGPGAPGTPCAFAASPQNSNGSGGGGGGAGGTFLSQGGAGGDGDAGGRTGGTPGTAQSAPTVLHGGCNGQRGGTGNTNGTAGAPGRGGGVVYLVSAGAITLAGNAIINASGSGAAASTSTRVGGSGGGSGGMIRFHAMSITAPANSKVVTNGGGGSSGGDGSGGGSPGADPDPATPTTAAAGGVGNGGNAGGGFAGTTQAAAGLDGDSNDGGGGGGGGGGFIQSNVSTGSAVTSGGAILIMP